MWLTWTPTVFTVLFCYILLAEATVVQLFGATTPTIYVTPSASNGASFWQLSASTTYYLIGWLKIEKLVPSNAQILRFATGNAFLEFYQTNFFTSCGTINGVNVGTSWFFFAFVSTGPTTFMKIQVEGGAMNYVASLGYSTSFNPAYAEMDFIGGTTGSKVTIVDVRFSTDTVTSAQVDALVAPVCSATCTCATEFSYGPQNYAWSTVSRSCVCSANANCYNCAISACSECYSGFVLPASLATCLASLAPRAGHRGARPAIRMQACQRILGSAPVPAATTRTPLPPTVLSAT